MTPEERDRAIDQRIRAIRAHRDFPALSEQIQEVVRVAQDEDGALDRLADLVLRNYGLTLKVLRTVNSIHYNRSGQPILSVARAVVLLGVRTVRDLATSFLVFDHYQKQSPELRRLMVLSMVTACHAEALSRWVRGTSPDEAYVCGMFRNLGEVLIAHHFPDDYVRIQADRSAERADAPLHVLGFRYEELGAAMARTWGMPLVGESMVPMGTGTALRAVTSLGHALTALVYRGDEAADPGEITRLFERHRRDVAVPPEEIDHVVQGAASVVRKLFLGIGAAPDELAILGRSLRPAQAESAADPAVGSGLSFASVREAREPLLAEVAAVLSQPEFDIHRALVMILEAMQRGAPFDRVLFCLVDDERAEIRARLSLGSEAERLTRKFRFPVGSAQTAIGACLIDREPLFVTPASLRPREGRLAKVLGVEEFAVLPLSVAGRAIGCLYGDRRVAAGAADPATLIFLGRVQAVAEQAIARSRNPVPVHAATLAD